MASHHTEQNNIAILAEYVDKYQELNWFLVPLQKGQKKPMEKNWTEKASCISPETKLTDYPGGIGLAHAYSRTCTIDLDDLVKARAWFSKKNINIDEYLNDPKSVKIVSGVANRAKLLYLLPPDIDPLPHVKRDADGFELRCATRKGTTIQDALPPTIHPKTNKPYSWEGDPSKTPQLPIELGKLWFEFIDNNKGHVQVKNAGQLMPFIQSAMPFLDMDMGYNEWISIGFALHSVGPDFLDVWDEWSSTGTSEQYQPGGCESRWLGFDQGGGVTLGTFFKFAYDGGWSPQDALMEFVRSYHGNNTAMIEELVALSYHISIGPMLFEDIIKEVKRVTGASVKAIKTSWSHELKRLKDTGDIESENFEMTHSQISDAFITDLKKEYPPEIVASQEQLWYYHDQYWKGSDRDRIAGVVARKFDEQKLCRTGTHYRQIASHVVSADQRPNFFSRSPDGVATRKGFFKINDQGEIEKEVNCADHRQRWLIPVEPKEGEMPLFMGLLQKSLGHDKDQIQLFQQVLGAILFNKLSISYQKAIIFFGAADTGKSVIIDVLRELFPDDRTTTISPEKFPNEYNLALLATSALNTYEELPDAKSISSPEFKALVAGGSISGRPIYGKPIDYRAKASHVFSSNYLPTTNEIDKAFFRRWILIHFKNPIADKDKDTEYTNKIVKNELSQIFHWGIEGMKALIKDGWVKTYSHDELMKKWTRTSNVVLEFINDKDWVLFDDEDKTMVKRSELYITYRDWSRYHDRTMISKIEFNGRVATALRVERPALIDGFEIWKGVGIAMDRPGF